ncbi:inovirus Gp2 family protein [Colwelliaceae bacterium 6471]
MRTINTPTFNGYPVQSNKGELFEDILLKNEYVLTQALSLYNRVVALRFDLRFPVGYQGESEVISKFIDALRFRLKIDVAAKSQARNRNLSCELSYVWVKEKNRSMNWHYHVVIFLNHDIYSCLGNIDSSNTNMYSRILESWASAIGISTSAAIGLVHVPDNPRYKIDKKSPTFYTDIQVLLHRLSYFAKKATKPYNSAKKQRFYGSNLLREKESVLADSFWL